jgi:hypothetical protein
MEELQNVIEKHKDYEASVGIGGRLLRLLHNREFFDYLVIGASCAVFFLTVLYIVLQRLVGIAEILI